MKTDYMKVKLLYDDGLSDDQIADIISVSKYAIRYWRRNSNLDANPRTHSTNNMVNHKKLMDLYEQGLTDIEISKIIGFESGVVFRWRKRNNLPSMYHKLIDEEISFKLYSLGHNDTYIANQLGVNREVIARWRVRNGLVQNTRRAARKITETITKSEQLPVEDPESLYCDSDFLSNLLSKEIRGKC